MLVEDRQISVRELDRDVDTRIEIRTGDRIIITSRGSIASGWWFAGDNGPNGWQGDVETNNASPLPGAPPFSLLGKLDNRYFFIGERFEQTYTGRNGYLFLRINDSAPGNGSGQFTCSIRVFREEVRPVVDEFIRIRESDYDCDTGILVKTDDRLVFNASGTIWAGVWFTGENGPDGWVGHRQTNPNAPLREVAPPYSLLGKIDRQYFLIGRSRERIHRRQDGRLYLRINDDAPGNGSGEFRCRVQVYRVGPPIQSVLSGKATIQTSHPDSRLAGPFLSEITATLEFSGDRTVVRLVNLPPISTTSQTPVGSNTTTVSRVGGGSGVFEKGSGHASMPIVLRFDNSLPIAGDSEIEFNLTTKTTSSGALSLTGSTLNQQTGAITLVGASKFRDGVFNDIDGSITIQGILNPLP